MTARNRLIASLVSAALLGILLVAVMVTGAGGTPAVVACLGLIAWNLYTAWRAWVAMR